MKAFIATTFIAAALLGAVLASAQAPSAVGGAVAGSMGGPWGHHEHGGRRGGHFGDLNLTADQKTAAHNLRKDMETKAEPIWTEAREQMKTIESMLEAGNADATELGNKMIAAHATRAQLKALHDDFDTKFSALLNADQLAKFQQFQAARKQFHDHAPEPPPGD